MTDFEQDQPDIEQLRNASLRDYMLDSLQNLSPLEANVHVLNAGLMANFHVVQRRIEMPVNFDAFLEGIDAQTKLAHQIEKITRLVTELRK